MPDDIQGAEVSLPSKHLQAKGVEAKNTGINMECSNAGKCWEGN